MDEEPRYRAFSARNYRFALRMRFAYEGGKVRQLPDVQRVEMLAPISPVELPREKVHGGFWVELHDADERVLYYQVLNNPIRPMLDDYSPDGTIRAVPNRNRAGEFELLIPDMPEAQTLVMFSSPLDRRRALRPATELARFDLKRSSSNKEG
jgi:hypothetical protein